MSAEALYRYRCTACGHKGRGYKDGNLAIVYGEQHVTNERNSGHRYLLEERQASGTWVEMA